MKDVRITRLGVGDLDQARTLFALLAEVFGEPRELLSTSYLEALLADRSFWAMAAFDGDEVVGGVTGYALAMTRSESREMFVYDIAVRPEHQRKGVGRRLLEVLAETAAASGIDDMFVFADNADSHALAFYRALGGAPSGVTCFSFARDSRVFTKSGA